jgi:hypothetical protein
MAVIKQGILGGVQNKIGNVVGSSWKGIAVLKSLPVSVANPRTAPQVAQRERFRNIVMFATAILAEVIKPLWDRFAQKQSGYNAFISRNSDYFTDAGLDIPSGLVISQGKMDATNIISATANAGSDEVTVNWTDDSGQGFKQATDTAFIVCRNRTTKLVKGYNTGKTRNLTSATVELECSAGNTIDIWLAFRRADGTIVSDTSYISVTAS